MPYQFTPPATNELPRTPARKPDPFWRHIRRGYSASSVLKFPNGAYKTIQTPDQNVIAQASILYQGGHIYDVSDDEAQDLIAAGYSVLGAGQTIPTPVENTPDPIISDTVLDTVGGTV